MFHEKSKIYSVRQGSPIPVAVRSEVWVVGSSQAGNAGNPTGVIDVCPL